MSFNNGENLSFKQVLVIGASVVSNVAKSAADGLKTFAGSDLGLEGVARLSNSVVKLLERRGTNSGGKIRSTPRW